MLKQRCWVPSQVAWVRCLSSFGPGLRRRDRPCSQHTYSALSSRRPLTRPFFQAGDGTIPALPAYQGPAVNAAGYAAGAGGGGGRPPPNATAVSPEDIIVASGGSPTWSVVSAPGLPPQPTPKHVSVPAYCRLRSSTELLLVLTLFDNPCARAVVQNLDFERVLLYHHASAGVVARLSTCAAAASNLTINTE